MDWSCARKQHYIVLDHFAGGPVYLSPWERSQEYWRNLDDSDRFSPEVCVVYDEEVEQWEREEDQKERKKDVLSRDLEETESERGGDVRAKEIIHVSHEEEDIDWMSVAPKKLLSPVTSPSITSPIEHEDVSTPNLPFPFSNKVGDILAPTNTDNSNYLSGNGWTEKIVTKSDNVVNASKRLDDDIFDDNDDDEVVESCHGASEDENGEDEIADFSQSLREEPPLYLRKKSRMNDSLFDKENENDLSSGRVRKTYLKNQLALETVPRLAISSSSTQGSRQQYPSFSLPHSPQGSLQASIGSSGDSSSGGNSTSRRPFPEKDMSSTCAMLPPKVSGSLGQRRSDGCIITNKYFPGDSADDRRRSVGANSRMSQADGLDWSESLGCFRKVDLVTANREYTKKKRSYQPTLQFKPVSQSKKRR
jgi:hypothetical protein